jgi:hypothetical protein
LLEWLFCLLFSFLFRQKQRLLTQRDHFRRQGFGRGNTKSTQNLKAVTNGSQAPSPVAEMPPPLLASPSVPSTLNYEGTTYGEAANKKFFNDKYAKCSVKGNFLTLAAQPKNVELGEWLAHQCEQSMEPTQKTVTDLMQW